MFVHILQLNSIIPTGVLKQNHKNTNNCIFDSRYYQRNLSEKMDKTLGLVSWFIVKNFIGIIMFENYIYY